MACFAYNSAATALRVLYPMLEWDEACVDRHRHAKRNHPAGKQLLDLDDMGAKPAVEAHCQVLARMLPQRIHDLIQPIHVNG